MDNVRHLQRQLGELSSRWEELVHGAADAIAVLDTGQTVAFANARWRDVLGVEGDELVGSYRPRMLVENLGRDSEFSR